MSEQYDENERQDRRRNQLEFMWKMIESSLDKNILFAKIALVGNSAALAGCAVAFREFKEKIGLDTVADAGWWFAIGILASVVMLALIWLGSEISAVRFGRVAVNDFSEAEVKILIQNHFRFNLPGREKEMNIGITIAGIILAIPYAISGFSFFAGIIHIANGIKCVVGCS
jgi:hypothetical protein